MREKKVKVLFIAGNGRSGSTILDVILGQLEGFFAVGELRRIWGSERDILEESETKAALEGRLRFQQFIADMSSQLLTATEDEAERVFRRRQQLR